jgi:thiol-disulfide isomerase/thioredoxin
MHGEPVRLEDFKGKTVLLDFWTTWCPPCRADAPALEKLYKKYNGKDLMIVGISVNEERPIVEKYLREHPKSYPIALTSENDLPRPYQVGAFPTYVVIDAKGNVSGAVDGDQGFSTLRKMLEKAGLIVD